MAIAYDPRDRRVYVCRADRSLPREQQTGWILKDLSSKTRTQIEDSVAFQVGGDGFSRGFNSMMRTALKHGLIGVEDDRPLRDRNDSADDRRHPAASDSALSWGLARTVRASVAARCSLAIPNRIHHDPSAWFADRAPAAVG